MNLKLDLNLKTLLPVLKRAQPYLVGLALIGLFGYTAWIVDQAMNVQPSTSSSLKPLPKISFDKKTIDSLKALKQVGGEVPLGNLGKDDPFK